MKKKTRSKKITAKADEFDLSSLTTNPRNPRTITEQAFKLLCNSVQNDPEFMSLRPIVIDEAGVVLGGNMRLRACLHLGKKMVPASWVVRASNLTDEQKKRFVVLDNSPQGMSGEWDFDILGADYSTEDLASLGLTSLINGTELDKYTRKVEPPIYTPSEQCPDVHDLVDITKANALIAEVESSSLAEPVKVFLKLAAYRHAVFNYALIADYYAHSDPDTKRLMENSALVLIDMDRAIELGFVNLTKAIAEQFGKDYKEKP